MTDQEIIELWDKYVGRPCEGYPLENFEILNFTRLILSRAIPEGHVVVPKDPTLTIPKLIEVFEIMLWDASTKISHQGMKGSIEQLQKDFSGIKHLFFVANTSIGWMPIETAPKDGTNILLYRGPGTYEGRPTEERITCGYWFEFKEPIPENFSDDCEDHWTSWDGGFLEELPPTHWMPLPAAPANKEG